MFKQVYRGKKVFVTGHTGFKGSWLAQWLLELGAEVTGFSDCVPTHPSLFEIAKLKDHLNDLRGDNHWLGTPMRIQN
jgi:CDP-glucose 4,6-dehydratase